MTPIALTDRQMHEVMDAAAIAPRDLRPAFLEQVAAELRGKDLGDGTVHKTAPARAWLVLPGFRSCGG
jgi:hypothetical protein